jgi:hypothetical protein
MSILDQFQRLDDLIIEHTKPPITAMLRGQLALTREQIEAYQASSDRQDETLAKQAELIATLQDKIKRLESKNSTPSLEIIDQSPMPPIEPLM